MRDIFFHSSLISMEDRPFEIVERKGIGHPDTLADGVAEAISLEYSAYCLKNFGIILHQTLDKIMFIGGLGKFGFGVGEMIKPWRLILNGRLTQEFAGQEIPFKEITVEATKNYLRKTVPKLDIDKWLKIEFYTSTFSKNPRWFKPKTLEDVPDATNPYANDTSVCVGYWPLSTTEKLALLLESYFYDAAQRPRFSFIGQDIKAMCVRRKKSIEITMCVPFFSKKTPDHKTYVERKERIEQELSLLAREFVKEKYDIEVYINTQDDMVNGVGHFFVISGSALDSGEEGVVGRGNRSRGIISTMRPNGIEAIQGKNPVYYVGKVYSYFTDLLSKKIAEEFECECQIYISSRNSDPILSPHNIFIETTRKVNKRRVIKFVQDEVEKKNWAKEIIKNKLFLPFPGGGNGYKSVYKIK